MAIDNSQSIDYPRRMKKKNVLVTGAAGFIGFHVAQALSSRGDAVAGLDNFNNYYTPALKRKRSEILSNRRIPVIEADVCDFETLKKIIKERSITHIVHLAAQAGVRYSLQNPHAYIKANLEGFLNILEICKENPSIKLTYASSSSVYGLNEKVPFSIDDRTDKQASLYGVTKKTNELMAETYAHLYGISAIGLRFFTVYGPWGRPDMAYYSFTKAILENKPIDIYNHGKMKRDFTYIDDIVQGTIEANDLDSKHAIFNLGNNNPVELGHFINVIEKAVGKEANKRYLPMQPGDVISTFADIKESSQQLSFKPTTSIEEGIPHFVEWYLSQGQYI